MTYERNWLGAQICFATHPDHIQSWDDNDNGDDHDDDESKNV